MPKLNHKNLGHISKTVYLPGVIKGLHQEGEGVAVENWDTADVVFDTAYSPVGETWDNVPIYYHCRDDVQERKNGALEEAATGFDIEDKVILMCELAEGKNEQDEGGQSQFKSVRVVAHQDGPRLCQPGYIFVFCRVRNKDHEDAYTEYVTVFKTRQGQVHTDLEKPGPPGEDQDDYVFPCPRAEIEPWLEKYLPSKKPEDQVGLSQGLEVQFNQVWPCEELFWKEEVKEIDGQLFVAGGTAKWSNDPHGYGVLGGEDDPEDSLITGHAATILNPTFKFFDGLAMKMIGAGGAGFDDVLEQAKTFTSKDWSGPGVVSDERNWVLTNPRPVDPLAGHLKGESLHYQVGYGEDQIFLCAREAVPFPSGGVMITQYCTDPIYYHPVHTVPDSLAHWGLADYMDVSQDKLALLQSTPSLGGGIGSMRAAQTAMNMGAIGTQAPLGDNLLVFIYLKMIHEGTFHADIYPAVGPKKWLSPGSFLYTQKNNPRFPEEPPVETALNTRQGKYEAWGRYDNWHNTIELATAIQEADPTWFFDCYASHSKWERYILDTPLGSLFYAAPQFRMLYQWSSWLPYQDVAICQDDIVARQDWPLRTQMWEDQRQSVAGLFQMYVVHRQGVSLHIYNDPDWEFGRDWYVVQSALTPPWDNLPPLSEVPDYEFEWTPDTGEEKILNIPAQEDFVGFVSHPDTGEQTHISNMTQEEILEHVSDLVFITSHEDNEDSELHNPSISYRNNRNEIEIMASADTWGGLFKDTSGSRCTNQERNPGLEKAIADLIDKTLVESGHGRSGFPEMDIKARMI